MSSISAEYNRRRGERARQMRAAAREKSLLAQSILARTHEAKKSDADVSVIRAPLKRPLGAVAYMTLTRYPEEIMSRLTSSGVADIRLDETPEPPEIVITLANRPSSDSEV